MLNYFEENIGELICRSMYCLLVIINVDYNDNVIITNVIITNVIITNVIITNVIGHIHLFIVCDHVF